jgi:hypothetical protein
MGEMFMAVKRTTRRNVRRASSSAAKLPARIERSAKSTVTKARRNHSSTAHFGRLIATAGLLIAAAASAAVFVPKPMLRDAKDKLGKNLVPLGNRVAELASRLAEDAENFGKSLRG